MRISYDLAVFDRQSEELIGRHEIPAKLTPAIRKIAGIPADDDGGGDYPLSAEQVLQIAKHLGIPVTPEKADYFLEPYASAPDAEKSAGRAC